MTRTGQNSARATPVVLVLLAAFASSPDDARADGPAAPQRVVSMNLCTDQLALLIARPAQLHSVSYISQDQETSVLAAKARRLPPNHGLAEEIFLMRPDLVLAGGFTRRATTDLLRRLGFRVEVFYPARSITAIRTNLERMGRLLGREAHAAALATAFETELANLTRKNSPGDRPRAALYYANNYTSASGTLAADIVATAGLDNIATGLGLTGMVKLPLELLVMARPHMIITERPARGHTARANETHTHPALAATAGASRIATDSTWSCGAPFTLDAIRKLQAAAAALGKRRAAVEPVVAGARR